MKKVYFFWFALLLNASFAFSQEDYPWNYTLEVFSQPYEKITYDTLGDYEWWEYWDAADDWFLNIGFTYEVMDVSVDELEFWHGDLIFVEPYDKVFISFGLALVDRGFISLTMPETYLLAQTTGELGDRVFIIEYDNAGILLGDSSEYVNVQIRLYEADNSLELHYGPCHVLPESYEDDGWEGPYIGFEDYVYANGVEGDELLFSLNGDPLAPEVVRSVYDQTGLVGTPPEGTVYRFTPAPPVSTDEVLTAPVSAWFAGTAIHLVSKELPLYDSYMLSDLQGRTLLRGHLPEGDTQSYDLALPAGLGRGMYLVTLQSKWGLRTTKVVID